MSNNRDAFKKQYVDKKIRRSGRVYYLIILIMFGIVIYDSFVFTLPFYYILYWLAGYFAGKVIWLSQKVVIVKETQMLSLEAGAAGKILSLILIVIRFFVGTIILKTFNVIWITDALYLIFIGVYLSKIISISKQVDEYLYKFFQKSKSNKN